MAMVCTRIIADLNTDDLKCFPMPFIALSSRRRKRPELFKLLMARVDCDGKTGSVVVSFDLSGILEVVA